MLTANEIMTRRFLTISPEMSVDELARLLLRKDVNGAIVVDRKGKLEGVVTEGHLIAKEMNGDHLLEETGTNTAFDAADIVLVQDFAYPGILFDRLFYVFIAQTFVQFHVPNSFI